MELTQNSCGPAGAVCGGGETCSRSGREREGLRFEARKAPCFWHEPCGGWGADAEMEKTGGKQEGSRVGADGPREGRTSS